MFKFSLNSNTKKLKKELQIVIFILLITFLISIAFMIISSSIQDMKRIELNHLNYYTELKNLDYLDKDIIKRIRNYKEVDGIFNVKRRLIKFDYLIGREFWSSIYFLKSNQAERLLEKMDLKVKKGRLPVEDKNEIILDWKLAANKGLEVGDKVNFKLNEVHLIEEYKLVGVLTGDSSFSYVPVKPEEVSSLTNSALVLHQKENAKKISNLLNYLGLNELSTVGSYFISYDFVHQKGRSWQKSLKLEFKDINLKTNLIMIILFIPLIILGSSLVYKSFYDQDYFSNLLADYEYKTVVIKILARLFLTIIFGFITGFILSLLGGWILNQSLFISNGYCLRIVDFDLLVKSSTLPLFIFIFSSLRVVKQIKNL